MRSIAKDMSMQMQGALCAGNAARPEIVGLLYENMLQSYTPWVADAMDLDMEDMDDFYNRTINNTR